MSFDIADLDRMHIAMTTLLVGYLLLFALQVKAVFYRAVQIAVAEFLRRGGAEIESPGKMKSLVLGIAWLLGSRGEDDAEDGGDDFSRGLFWLKLHTVCIMVFVAVFVMFTSVSTKIRFDDFARKIESMEAKP